MKNRELCFCFMLIMDSSKKNQADKFREAARQLETDDDEARFEERLKGLVKQKPDDKKSSDD